MGSKSIPCSACKNGIHPPFPYTMAFQPIVNVARETVYAYEALVRGLDGESAGSILSQLTPENLYAFDQSCRVKAIQMAADLNLAQTGAALSINFMPGAVYNPATCIRLTLETAAAVGFPTDQLIFEVVEQEEVIDPAHLKGIAAEYRRLGLRIALDDFGAGFCGLNLLADLSVDVIKLDRRLTRNIDVRPKSSAIVEAMVVLAHRLGCELVAEGVESVDEYEKLRSLGINLMQGHLFAHPAMERLPRFVMPLPRAANHSHPSMFRPLQMD